MKNKTVAFTCLVWVLILGLKNHASAQKSEWQKDIGRLKNAVSTLFIGVNPDDLNKKYAAYLLDKTYCRVGFISLTRGENSNLDSLSYGMSGIQRSIYHTNKASADIGKLYSDLYFTRAYDLLSGGREDSIDIFEKQWDRRSILGDIVWEIRTFRPDVILFPSFQDMPHKGMRYYALQLISEAIKLAGDSNYFKEQFEENRYPCQPTRVIALDSLNGKLHFTVNDSLNIGYNLIAGSLFKEQVTDGIDKTWNRIYQQIDKGYNDDTIPRSV